MNWLDIVIAIPILWGLWKGFRDGIILQLGGIAGIILGVWLAFRHGRAFGVWLHFDPPIATVAGFTIILIGVLLLIALVGRLTRGLFRISGLGMIDQIGGLILGGIKILLIVSLLLYGFDFLNRKQNWVEQQTLDRSSLYRPVKNISNYVFPYVDFAKRMLFDKPETNLRET